MKLPHFKPRKVFIDSEEIMHVSNVKIEIAPNDIPRLTLELLMSDVKIDEQGNIVARRLDLSEKT